MRVTVPRGEDFNVLKKKEVMIQAAPGSWVCSSKSHMERIMTMNFQTILKLIPGGDQYRVTGTGKVEEKPNEEEYEMEAVEENEGYTTVTGQERRPVFRRGGLRGHRGAPRGGTRGGPPCWRDNSGGHRGQRGGFGGVNRGSRGQFHNQGTKQNGPAGGQDSTKPDQNNHRPQTSTNRFAPLSQEKATTSNSQTDTQSSVKMGPWSNGNDNSPNSGIEGMKPPKKKGRIDEGAVSENEIKQNCGNKTVQIEDVGAEGDERDMEA